MPAQKAMISSAQGAQPYLPEVEGIDSAAPAGAVGAVKVAVGDCR